LTQLAGVYYAGAYGVWQIKIAKGPVPAGAGATMKLFQGVVTLSDGKTLMPFAVGAPITIGVGTSAETVAVTAFSNCFLESPPGNPSVSATTSFAHGQGDIIQSGSSGLFEACLDCFNRGGGTVVIDASWTGTAANITAAQALYPSIQITDLRTQGQSPTYSGPASYQPVAIDLTLDAGAGKDNPNTAQLGPIMGNLHGDALTKTGDYLFGVRGAYSITGSGAATQPKGALLGSIEDGSVDANGAVVAWCDGDSAVTQAGAAFKVRNRNSVPNSGFDYGVDLADAAGDGFPAVAYRTADIRLSSLVVVLSGAVDPSAGAGVAAPQGSLYLRTNGGAGTTLYVKEGAADTAWAGK